MVSTHLCWLATFCRDHFSWSSVIPSLPPSSTYWSADTRRGGCFISFYQHLSHNTFIIHHLRGRTNLENQSGESIFWAGLRKQVGSQQSLERQWWEKPSCLKREGGALLDCCKQLFMLIPLPPNILVIGSYSFHPHPAHPRTPFIRPLSPFQAVDLATVPPPPPGFSCLPGSTIFVIPRVWDAMKITHL